jgi:TatD DNase family protein
MLIDAHTHLDRYLYRRFGGAITPVLEQIEKHKILSISNSIDLASYKTNRKISEHSRLIIPAFGIHPWNAYEYVNKTELTRKLVKENEIIGEIGLDYYYVRDEERRSFQRDIFELFLSETRDKIISIHTKGAERDVLNLLRRYGNEKVIIHWYSGDLDTLEKMIKEGYYFSISPEIGISNHVKKIAQKIPLNHILTETDNPGGPQSYLGKKGMPILIKDVVKEIAQIKKKSPKRIEKAVQENFTRLARELEIPI